MDWGKAKTILIITFMGLNILLYYQWWQIQGEAPEYLPEAISQEEDLLRYLEQKDIILDTEMTANPQALPGLSLVFGESAEMVVFDSPIDQFQAGDSFLEWLADNDLHQTTYRRDHYMELSDQIVYVQNHEGWPIFNARLVLWLEDGMVTSYKQIFATAEEGDLLRVLPAVSVLRTLAENHISSGSTIADIQLGYHGQQFDADIQYFTPYWRVILLGGTTYYVHALTGSVEIAQRELAVTQ